ncbi:MAG: hypothetical protein RI990_1394 [Planctomycetota bacterium]|jgi:hypothetical protein
MTRAQVVDAYFMEHRARLLDVAAFLDRVDRAGSGDDDFRMHAFREAVAILGDGGPDRARRVLELFSDPTTEPVAKAGMKGATGAHDPSKGGG